MGDDPLISVQTGLQVHCSLVQASHAPTQSFAGLSLTCRFRRKHRCAPVIAEPEKCLPILFGGRQQGDSCSRRLSFTSALNDGFEGNSLEGRQLLPHLTSRKKGAPGHSVSHIGALR